MSVICRSGYWCSCRCCCSCCLDCLLRAAQLWKHRSGGGRWRRPHRALEKYYARRNNCCWFSVGSLLLAFYIIKVYEALSTILKCYWAQQRQRTRHAARKKVKVQQMFNLTEMAGVGSLWCCVQRRLLLLLLHKLSMRLVLLQRLWLYLYIHGI